MAANKDVKTNSGITFQNVKTQTINVDGKDFYYRKLGENNAGIPVIFLNHLAATMDNCDPFDGRFHFAGNITSGAAACSQSYNNRYRPSRCQN